MLLLLVVIGFLGRSQVHGQAHDSTLSGTVKFSSGVPVADVHLVIKNAVTNELKTLAVKRNGSFTIPKLSPGKYEITASTQRLLTRASQ